MPRTDQATASRQRQRRNAAPAMGTLLTGAMGTTNQTQGGLTLLGRSGA
jgi:hypothetical protein